MSVAAKTVQTDFTLRRPLAAGQPVVHWRLGPIAEQRYDVADQPMKGEMDPFFFLTKHKNFIPHEYPCRTQFAAERRGKRPQVGAEFSAGRIWLPFASPRVDLSGFWFRPTVLGTWAETIIDAASAGEALLRLRTCGGAVLFVNGGEAGWMAPYGRNLESAEDFRVALSAGRNDIRIWFDDLAERDARYYFQLDYLSGPAAAVALPIEVEGAVADAMEAALDDMRFERPAYDGGEVALVTGVALPRDAQVAVEIEGDFMSIEAPVRFAFELSAGQTRLPIADTEQLPADFRHFKVTLTIGGHAASRVFGVEICHARRQGGAPETLAARIDEALSEVAGHAEADTVRALARLAKGQEGTETDAMISGVLPAIEDCHDCADFILVPLLWCRRAYGDRLDAGLRGRVDKAILGYRYWMDEPGNDVQWYFSENHALLFHTAAYLAGGLLPQARFARSGRSGREQSAVGAARVRAWLDHFEAWEMAEFNSAPYFPIDLKGLCALYALAPDKDIADRAGKAVIRLLEIVARSAHHGMLTGAQGRSYEHTLRAARSLELSGICRMVWGKGNYGMRFHALPQLALCLRDHGLSIPAELAPIASVADDTAWEWSFAQGQDRFARLYHHKTRGHAMGSASGYRWNQWGYQETVLHARLGGNADAQIWINHPGEVLQSGYGRPSYWGGSGTLPRVHQYRDLAVVSFSCSDEQPDFTHAWFPAGVFDTVRIDGQSALAQAGDAFAMLMTDVPLSQVTSGPTAGNELRAAGRKATWIVRLGDRNTNLPTLESWSDAFAGLSLHSSADGQLTVEDPEYGTVRFLADATIVAEGRTLDPASWTVRGEATRMKRRE
ncbi:hypothetical protein FJ970_12135 [Mesorhizobium sp. B2-1-8]|uniref:hypothetical protein n=1 Tax=Mesorhizobium sp. B2-1-8 TaxID=2589967 RepID=UPI001D128D70|nr:hypothetical protein [Mesorhizobium sp. B2-1-8]UCI21652.1 hypothetical protein FJ970_12135 [Mesorhizobium sp. B2-1-8]